MRVAFKEEDDQFLADWYAKNDDIILSLEKMVNEYVLSANDRPVDQKQRIIALDDYEDLAKSIAVSVFSLDSRTPFISLMGQLAGRIRATDSNKDRFESFVTAGELLLKLCSTGVAQFSYTSMGTLMFTPSYKDTELQVKYLSMLPLNKPTKKHMTLGKYDL